MLVFLGKNSKLKNACETNYTGNRTKELHWESCWGKLFRIWNSVSRSDSSEVGKLLANCSSRHCLRIIPTDKNFCWGQFEDVLPEHIFSKAEEIRIGHKITCSKYKEKNRAENWGGNTKEEKTSLIRVSYWNFKPSCWARRLQNDIMWQYQATNTITAHGNK